jgi:hypothetical protein
MTAEMRKVESSEFGIDGKKTQWLKNVANLSAMPIVPHTKMTSMQSCSRWFQLL